MHNFITCIGLGERRSGIPREEYRMPGMLSRALNCSCHRLQRLFEDLVTLAWEDLELVRLPTFNLPYSRCRGEHVGNHVLLNLGTL